MFLSDKKLAGILCEITTLKDLLNVYIGIGINVNTKKEELQKISQKATSLKEETKYSWNRKKLISSLLDSFFNNYLKLFLEKGFTPFYKEFEELLAFRNEEVECEDDENKYKGTIHSLASNGGLNLLLENNEIKTFLDADLFLIKK